LRIAYRNKFIEDRLAFTSTIQLYSNYVRDPQNIDLLCQPLLLEDMQHLLVAYARNKPNGGDGNTLIVGV